MTKKTLAWAIVDRARTIRYIVVPEEGTPVRDGREETISRFLCGTFDDSLLDWEKKRKQGYRCIPVEIREVARRKR